MIDSVNNAVIQTPGSPTTSGSKSTRDTPEAIAKASSQFEALLIGEILKSARESDGSDWLGTEDEAGSSLMDMSEQQLSQALASGGGLGLAKMIAAGLTKTASHSASQISGPADGGKK